MDVPSIVWLIKWVTYMSLFELFDISLTNLSHVKESSQL